MSPILMAAGVSKSLFDDTIVLPPLEHKVRRCQCTRVHVAEQIAGAETPRQAQGQGGRPAESGAQSAEEGRLVVGAATSEARATDVHRPLAHEGARAHGTTRRGHQGDP